MLLLYQYNNYIMQAIQDSEEEQICIRCQTNQQVFISLKCEHNYCLVCMSYILIKCRANGSHFDEVTCPICNDLTKLSEDTLQAIHTTIQQTLLPILPKLNNVKETIEEVSGQNTNEQQLQKAQSSNKRKKSSQLNLNPKNDLQESKNSIEEFKEKIKMNKRYSEQPSFDHITPSTKYFFSKCDSPNSKDKILEKQYCQVHPFQQLTFVCLTCQNQILCLKCVIGNKHKTHNIQNIKKGIDYLNDQISMNKIQVNEKIEYYQMWQRRMYDKKEMIKQKWDRTKEQIQENFEQVINKLKKKENELLQMCDKHYQNLKQSLDKEIQKLTKDLVNLKTSKSGFKALVLTQKQKSHQFFPLFNKLKININTSLSTNYEPEKIKNFQATLTLNQKDMIPIIDEINKINLTLNHKTKGTRLQTNFTSVNSSREKQYNNKKKYWRTEQDQMLQCGLKRKTETTQVQSIQKIQKCKGKDNIPAYITKFLDKQNMKPSKGSINDIQKTMTALQNYNSSSKISSKILSKTIISKDFEKKLKKMNSNEKLQKKNQTIKYKKMKAKK